MKRDPKTDSLHSKYLIELVTTSQFSVLVKMAEITPLAWTIMALQIMVAILCLTACIILCYRVSKRQRMESQTVKLKSYRDKNDEPEDLSLQQTL